MPESTRHVEAAELLYHGLTARFADADDVTVFRELAWLQHVHSNDQINGRERSSSLGVAFDQPQTPLLDIIVVAPSGLPLQRRRRVRTDGVSVGEGGEQSFETHTRTGTKFDNAPHGRDPS